MLDDTQKEMKKAFEKSPLRKFIFLCARRLGKSYLLVIIALELLIRTKSEKIIYVTDSFKAAKNIIKPLMDKITATAPKSVKPVFRAQDMKYIFPNGSELYLHGADKDPDSTRGQEGALILVDEAGFVNKLGYLVSNVLMPMLLLTNGRLLMATTPPKDEDHDFLRLLELAEAKNGYIKRTIYDCPRVSEKMIAEYMEEAGGEHSDSWQREYLCRIIRNQNTAVLPEFTEEKRKELVKENKCTEYGHTYVGMDLGFIDFTAAVFGWYDFVNGVFCIEDEVLINRENTSLIAEKIKEKEKQLWALEPFRRVADCNSPQFIHDLATLHGLNFNPDPRTGTKEGRINKLRLMIARNEIIIHPRCQNLIAQLKFCKWKNSERINFDRSESFGHYDLVDATIIIVNAIERGINPVPVAADIYTQHLRNELDKKDEGIQSLVPDLHQNIIRRDWS